MKIAVVYTSKYGTTQQYAQWIAKDVGADLLRQDACKVKDLEKYECLVFGGPIHAGGILALGFAEELQEIVGQKDLCFCGGTQYRRPGCTAGMQGNQFCQDDKGFTLLFSAGRV